MRAPLRAASFVVGLVALAGSAQAANVEVVIEGAEPGAGAV